MPLNSAEHRYLRLDITFHQQVGCNFEFGSRQAECTINCSLSFYETL
ncbi:MAG: hypothetical protein IK079_05855 [Desulfovibrio sp.]|nr:hypothetical protein [Desulfovibrio sp.]